MSKTSVPKVSDATNYTYEKVDQILDTTQQYVDCYLPEDKSEGAEPMEMEGEKNKEESMLHPDPHSVPRKVLRDVRHFV